MQTEPSDINNPHFVPSSAQRGRLLTPRSGSVHSVWNYLKVITKKHKTAIFEATISNRSILIVKWTQQYGFALRWSRPAALLPQPMWSLVCSRDPSILNVTCLVSFCFFFMYIYTASARGGRVTECRRQFRYLVTNQTFNKSSQNSWAFLWDFIWIVLCDSVAQIAQRVR